MALSRKRRKELNRLKGQAEDLWSDQKDLLENASKMVRDASRQAASYAREEVTPRLRDTIEETVKPAVSSSIAGARSAVNSGRDKVMNDLLPNLNAALGTALAALEVAKNQQVRDAASRASRLATDVRSRVGLAKTPPPKSAGPGRYILIGLGVVTFAAVAYAAYQTLRADDDLWFEDAADEPIADAAK